MSGALLGTLVLIFAVIKILTILGDETTIWAWVGLILAIVIAAGAFMEVQAAGGIDTLKSEIPARGTTGTTAPTYTPDSTGGGTAYGTAGGRAARGARTSPTPLRARARATRPELPQVDGPSFRRFREEDPVLPWTVVVRRHAIDLEAECLVERDRVLVGGRRDAAHGRASSLACCREEPFVQLAAEAGATALRRDPEEVDVGIRGVSLGEEPDQKPGEVTVVLVLRDETRPLEVDEEELGQHRRRLAAVPPGVDVLNHARVGRLGHAESSCPPPVP